MDCIKVGLWAIEVSLGELDTVSLKQTAVFFLSATCFIFCGISLVISLNVGHVNVVADRPVVLFASSLQLPMWLYHHVMPFLLASFLHGFLWLENKSSLPTLLLRLIALSALASIWLTDLARHDRWLTLYQGSLLISAFLPNRVTCIAWRHSLRLSAASLIVGMISYGAVFGETRCAEWSYVKCLTDTGPRNWVPSFLDRMGFFPFADFEGEDLSGADMADRDLRYANFTEANLEGATFIGANLRRAKLDRVKAAGSSFKTAYLDGATFVGSDLAEADLRRVHAFRIDLSDSNLRNADARKASLSHANFSHSSMFGLRLDGAYLRFSENLEQTQLSDACGNSRTRLPAGLSILSCPNWK